MKEEMVVVGVSGNMALVRGEKTSACGTCSSCHVTASGNLLEIQIPPGIEVGRKILVDTGSTNRAKDNRLRALVVVLGFTITSLIVSFLFPHANDAFLLLGGIFGGMASLYMWHALWKRFRRKPIFVRVVDEVKHWEPMEETSSISWKASG